MKPTQAELFQSYIRQMMHDPARTEVIDPTDDNKVLGEFEIAAAEQAEENGPWKVAFSDGTVAVVEVKLVTFRIDLPL